MNTPSDVELKSFESIKLNERLVKAVNEIGYEELTPVQAQAIPQAVTGVDLLVSARTGSGKTAAFILPVLQQLMENKPAGYGMRALVMAPTRELAQQIMAEAKQLAKYTRLNLGLITGGESFTNQVKILRKNPEIIIATPGRIKEHFEKGKTDFKDLEILVLDEADRMLEMGFTEDVLMIAKHARDARQTLLYSATMQRKGLEAIIAKVLKNPNRVVVDELRQAHKHIKQQSIRADSDGHKNQLLNWLLTHEKYKKVIVFVNAKSCCSIVANTMEKQSNAVGTLHGDMEQEERTQITRWFRDGKFQILVATDIAGRGLDIANVDLVINYHVPRNGDDYIHRIGRCGRAGSEGLAISLVGENELELKTRIEGYAQTIMTERSIEGLQSKSLGLRNKGNRKARPVKPGKDAKNETYDNKKRFKDSAHTHSDGFTALKRKNKPSLLPDQDEGE
jgi:ATP-dependent RNA helicase SrmB